MNSKLYVGEVMHARGWPVKHRFRYPVYFWAFDLDELATLDDRIPLFGHNRRAVFSMWDRDYLAPGVEPLRARLDACLAEHGCADGSVSRVMLLTGARFCGYVFNPVSFFFCYNKVGALRCVVAYVTNTFSESHLYVLTDPLPPLTGFAAHYQARKDFHVSPFFDLEGTYDFHFSELGEQLDILLHLAKKDAGKVFAARLRLQARELTTKSLLRTWLRWPLTAVKTFPRICWQAAKLHYHKKLPVFHKPNPASVMTVRAAPPKFTRRFAMNSILSVLERIEAGSIAITMPDRTKRMLGTPGAKPHIALNVHNYDFFWRLLTAGDTGLGESFMAGNWECEDPAALIKLLIRNWETLQQRSQRAAFARRTVDVLRHLRSANTLTGSRRNIRAHYDVSNDFFRTFLDDSMTYSCGLFETDADTLDDAQKRKLHSIIRKAGIQPGDQVLEIGCGWGSFAIEAVRETGCRVTGLTVSEEQLRLARERVHEAGLDDAIRIELCDYRKAEGLYDRIVSIEMLEAVGHRYLGTFFQHVDRLLKPGGLAAIQVITIPDQRYAAYRRSSDWIRQYIFPGGHVPSLGAMGEAMARDSKLVVDQVENIGPHYAVTLREWRRRFDRALDRIAELGFDQEFIRKWRFYFCYCEAGFETRMLDNLQLVLRHTGPQ